MAEKLDKAISESKATFKRIDKIVSKSFLYYAAICGFIFGWVALALIFHAVSGEIPPLFVILLRVFYFLLSFIFGIKVTLLLIYLFKKK